MTQQAKAVSAGRSRWLNWAGGSLFAVVSVTGAAIAFPGAREAAFSIFRAPDADEAWKQLLTGGEDAPDTGTAAFLANVERSDRRLRDEGEKYWSRFPDDRRRFDWLMATVHMPPHYPADVNQWAAAASNAGANGSRLNRKALGAWEKRFRSYRKEFMSAREVTERDRRYLEFGELRHRWNEVADRNARGENPALPTLLSDTSKFFNRYPATLGDNDQGEFRWIAETLSGQVLRTYDRLSASNRTTSASFPGSMLDAFVEAMAASSNMAVRELAGEIRTARLYGSVVVFRAFSDLPLLQPLSEDTAEWRLLPEYPHYYRDNFVGKYIQWHDIILSRRLYRDWGAKLFSRSANADEKLLWLSWANAYGAEYPERLSKAYFVIASENVLQYKRNHAARANWARTYRAIESAFLADPRYTTAQKSNVVSQTLKQQLYDAMYFWRHDRNNRPALQLMQDLLSFYRRYGNDVELYRHAATLLREPSSFGLSDADLRDFFHDVGGFHSPILRELAQAAENQHILRSTPFAFKAPTLDGKPFDISSMRGKVVLVDHWATTCASCVQNMPKLQAIYQKLRGSGFEVVSIVYDGVRNERMVRRTNKDLDLKWVTLVADDQWESIATKYGYTGFPQYMLLRRDGTLAASTGEITGASDLEQLITDVLRERP